MRPPADVRVVDADLERPEHQRAVVDLLDGYVREPIIGGRPLPEDTKRALVPALRRHPTTRVLLAYAGDEAVGIAVCFLGFSTFAARPLINVHDLAVRADWRKRGVGRRLLRAVEERARATGCCRLTLEVRGDNDPARELYASLGFASDAGDTPTLFLSRSLDPPQT